MTRKQWWIICGVIVILWSSALVYTTYAIYIWSRTTAGTSYYSPWAILNQTITEDGWVFTVIHRSERDWEKVTVLYWLYTPGDTYWETKEDGALYSIKGQPSGYNITWFDNDNDNVLSVNDTIFIGRMGGPQGKAEKGDKFELICVNEHRCSFWRQVLE